MFKLASGLIKMKNRKELANAIRALSIDAVERAHSGHPGMPMGMADIAESLWRIHLRHNPNDPNWINRDRFVVSNGHGSMLLYSLLHLTGYDLTIEDLKNFRQLGSRTPGHPEFGLTCGVETTTGPLGQGLANAVGMAIAENVLSAEFNEPGFQIFDHNTYVLLGDGCLMEGVSHEASSLAGVLGLGKLIAIYDDNGISIDSDKGDIKGWFNDDTPARFDAYNWHVIRDVDGHDSEAIDKAILDAQANQNQPTLICCKTIIGKGSPNKQGTGGVHGAPLGPEEIDLTKKEIKWNYRPFEIPSEIYNDWNCSDRGKNLQNNWAMRFEEYSKKFPQKASEITRRIGKKLPDGWSNFRDKVLKEVETEHQSIATRKASQQVIDSFKSFVPELLGGSADLAASNLTMHSDATPLKKGNRGGDYIFYGVREFGMAAIMNGIELYGGLIPFGGTFLVFSDYARNSLRMSALMKLRMIYVFTHDSIGLGEDGPTHQPIEHASSLRMIPNMTVWRPCDAFETAVSWIFGLENTTGPTSILLSRQSLPFQDRSSLNHEDVFRGGYTLVDEKTPDGIILATGSEVTLAVQASKLLKNRGHRVRVVSMPSTNVFDEQSEEYKNKILPDGIPIVAVEAGITDFWRKYVGLQGGVLGVDSYGESAPAKDVFEHFGLTVDNLVDRVESILDKKSF